MVGGRSRWRGIPPLGTGTSRPLRIRLRRQIHNLVPQGGAMALPSACRCYSWTAAWRNVSPDSLASLCDYKVVVRAT